MWLGMAFVGTARAVKARAQPADLEGTVQPLARLAGRHGQKMAGRREFVDQCFGAIEQQQILVARHVVMTIAQCDVLIAFLGQVRQGVAQGIDQAEADDVVRPLVGWLRNPQIARCRLDAGDDGTGRIHQRTVPVEDDQFKTFAHSPCFSFGRFA